MANAKQKDELLGKLIMDFANSQNSTEALTGLVKNTQRTLGFSKKWVDSHMVEILKWSQSEGGTVWYSVAKERLANFLNQASEPSLFRMLSLKAYVLDYNHALNIWPAPEVIVAKDGTLSVRERTPERYFDASNCDYFIAHAVVSFLLSNKDNVRLIHKCRWCGRYFLAKTKRLGVFFCSKKCRLTWHNNARIQSGKAKEYKKRKRREGARETYY